MNLLPAKFIKRHQAKLLFLILWAHVTILDLCYVTYAGPVFFFEENLQPSTLFIHLSVAFCTLFFYFVLLALFSKYQQSNSGMNTKADKLKDHHLEDHPLKDTHLKDNHFKNNNPTEPSPTNKNKSQVK